MISGAGEFVTLTSTAPSTSGGRPEWKMREACTGRASAVQHGHVYVTLAVGLEPVGEILDAQAAVG